MRVMGEASGKVVNMRLRLFCVPLRIFVKRMQDLTPTMRAIIYHPTAMAFPEQLEAARKARRLTAVQLAEMVGIHYTQLRRYETGANQPTLDILRKLAVALNLSLDELAFSPNERVPGDDLRPLLAALNDFSADERHVIREMIEGLILKHTARKFGA